MSPYVSSIDSHSLHAIEYIRKGHNVRRYHQHYLAQEDTVGKHSAGVGAFILIIDPQCSKEMLEYALLHDIAEYSTGDIPANAKRALTPSAREEFKAAEDDALATQGICLPQLTTHETLLFKLCDYFDGLAFCTEELKRGNRTLTTVGDTYLRYLPEYFNNVPRHLAWYARAQFVMNKLTSQWREACGR